MLRLFTFYFPGWKAYVDGAQVPIELSEPEGWINVWLSPGQHTVLVRLEETPVRRVAWGISTLALLALVVLAAWRLRLKITRPRPEDLLWQHAALLSAVVLGGLGLRLAADGLGWWRVHSSGREVLVAQHVDYARLEDDVAFLAYDLPQTSARRGSTVPVTLYWKALATVPVNLRVFVHLIGPDGQLWGQSDKWNPADFPTGRWPLDHYVRDEHDLAVRPDAPPGRYQVYAGLWDGDTGQRMHVLEADAQPVGSDRVLLLDGFEVRP
jgi:hypothetical protein